MSACFENIILLFLFLSVAFLESLNHFFSACTSIYCMLQIAASMLDGWEENLAILTANRTKDDELVIIHLGDCLWKERREVIQFLLV